MGRYHGAVNDQTHQLKDRGIGRWEDFFPGSPSDLKKDGPEANSTNKRFVSFMPLIRVIRI